jgi:hypothetical protein
MFILLTFEASATHFSINSLGHAIFRLNYNDSIQFFQNGTESFLVFDTNAAHYVKFFYTAPISIPYELTYAISVSGSTTMVFEKNLTTTVSVFTIPVNTCNRGSKSITGIASINYTFDSPSPSDFCLFPLATHYSELIRVDPPGVSTFFSINGTKKSIRKASLSALEPFYLRIQNAVYLTVEKVHFTTAETNWNLCAVNSFVFVSDSGAEKGSPIGTDSIRCFLAELDAGAAESIDIIISIVVLFVVAVGIPAAVQVCATRRLLPCVFRRTVPNEGSLTGYEWLGSGTSQHEATKVRASI